MKLLHTNDVSFSEGFLIRASFTYSLQFADNFPSPTVTKMHPQRPLLPLLHVKEAVISESGLFVVKCQLYKETQTDFINHSGKSKPIVLDRVLALSYHGHLLRQ